MAHAVDLGARLLIEAECRRLVDDFALAIDARHYDRVMAMFTPDAHYEPIGHVLDGHAAIRRYLDNRPQDRVTLHVMGNVVIDVGDDRFATGRSYVTYVNAAAVNTGDGAPFDGITLIAGYEDAFVMQGGAWRFARRLCRPIVRRR